MKKNRFITLIVATVTALICLSGCAGIKKLEDIRVTSANVKSIVPEGLKGIKVDLAVGVDNPGVQVSLSEISCAFKHSGKVIGNVAIDPFTLNAKTEDIYDLRADIRLAEGISVFELGKFLDKAVLDEATVDFSAAVRLKSGASKTLSFDDIPLKKLIETAK